MTSSSWFEPPMSVNIRLLLCGSSASFPFFYIPNPRTYFKALLFDARWRGLDLFSYHLMPQLGFKPTSHQSGELHRPGIFLKDALPAELPRYGKGLVLHNFLPSQRVCCKTEWQPQSQTKKAKNAKMKSLLFLTWNDWCWLRPSQIIEKNGNNIVWLKCYKN